MPLVVNNKTIAFAAVAMQIVLLWDVALAQQNVHKSDLDPPAIPVAALERMDRLKEDAINCFLAGTLDKEIKCRQEYIELLKKYQPTAGGWHLETEKAGLDCAIWANQLSPELRAKAIKARERLKTSQILRKEGRHDQALEFVMDAIRLYLECGERQDLFVLECSESRAKCLRELKQLPEASKELLAGVALSRSLLGKSHPFTALRLTEYAAIELEQGHTKTMDLDRAIAEAAEIYRVCGFLESPDYAQLLTVRAIAANNARQFELARACAKDAISITSTKQPKEIKVFISAHGELVVAYEGLKQYHESLLAFAWMNGVADRYPDSYTNTQMIRWLTAYRNALLGLRRVEEADRISKELDAMNRTE